jgi:hypothetical protein
MSTATHPVSPVEIMAFLDGELSAERAQSVSAHAQTCAGCQEVFASLQTVSQQVGNWQVQPPPLHLENQTAVAVLENRSSRNSLLAVLKQRLSSRVIGWTAAVVSGFVLLVAISVPNLLRSRMGANEASSVGSLRTINTAAVTYREKYGHYPPSLKSLGPSATGQESENGAGLIDSSLADGVRAGYRYSYNAAPSASGGYTVDAEPLQTGSTGQRHFSTDQTGVLNADNVPLDKVFSNQIPTDSELQRYGPKPGLTLDKTKSDLQMSRGPLQDKSRNPVAINTLTEPMIARTVSLSIILKDFDSARASLDGILARHHGYAANLSANTPQEAARSIQASLRIPAPQLVAALAELKSLGRVEVENQNGEEVTQQHADLVARLKNSRETEQRLQAILTQRTGKISDVLEVEQEIARVRGEIEQMEAEQKNLEHRVEFATIDLKLSEEYKAKLDSPTPSISTQLHNALVNGYRNVADTLIALLLFFAEYGPILLFLALLLFIPAWLVWRRLRHAHAI